MFDRCDRQTWWYSTEERLWADETGVMHPQGRPIRRVLSSGRDCSVAPGCVLAAFILPVQDTPDAIGPLAFSGPPGPLRPVAVDVGPTAGLHDGAAVTVVGTNLISGYPYEVEECGAAGQGWPVLCSNWWGTPDAGGRMAITVNVKDVIVGDRDVADCRKASCYLWIPAAAFDTNYQLSFVGQASPATTTTSALQHR